jgi:hypothetical protein
MKKINLIFNGYNNGKNLLYFIKTIKEATGMGLKESKDFCDDVYCQYEKTIQPVNREIYLNNDFTEKGEPLEKWLERILNRDVGRFSVMYKEKQRQNITVFAPKTTRMERCSETTKMSFGEIYRLSQSEIEDIAKNNRADYVIHSYDNWYLMWICK